MKTWLWIGAASALLAAPSPRPQERDLYLETAKHLARAMRAELDVLSVEFLVVANSTGSPEVDAPIVVINDSFRAQIKGFRALVRKDGPTFEEGLSALLRASLVIEALRWDLGDRKRIESLKDSFTAAQWKRIESLLVEQKDLTPESLKNLVNDHLTEAKKAASAVIEALSN